MNRIPPLLVAMRVNHWTKNSLVVAPFMFAYFDHEQQLGLFPDLARAIGAACCFGILSSAVYLFNDLVDREADRRHPMKRFRPIAAGTVTPSMARRAAVGLLAMALAGALLLGTAVVAVLAGYALLQLVYTCRLKHIALLDVFIIASGFVLRAICGAVAIEATISPWLLLCTFLLALFLALCKRRHELSGGGHQPDGGRAALAAYDAGLLDQLIAIVSASTIVSYALYTLSETTIGKFGTARLGFTIPMVMFGLFRYLDLVYRHDLGERPEKILLTDTPIIVTILVYTLAVVLILAAG